MSESITVRDIMAAYLKVNGFDGLFSEMGECGCDYFDLAPFCEGGFYDCVPAYRFDCQYCRKNQTCTLERDSELPALYSPNRDLCKPDYAYPRNAEYAAESAAQPTLQPILKEDEPKRYIEGLGVCQYPANEIFANLGEKANETAAKHGRPPWLKMGA